MIGQTFADPNLGTLTITARVETDGKVTRTYECTTADGTLVHRLSSRYINRYLSKPEPKRARKANGVTSDSVRALINTYLTACGDDVSRAQEARELAKYVDGFAV